MRRFRLSIEFWNPFGFLPLGLLAGLGLAATSALAQPANDLWQNATPIGGQWGSIIGSNLGATNQPGEPNHAGNPATWSIWYAWTAPESGEVTFDTLGSTNSSGALLDTLLAVYTGSSVSSLLQVAANDDYYPLKQQLVESQTFLGTLLPAVPILVPFTGPSVLRFNAVAGTTYYIAVDSKLSRGTVSLNWAFRPSGVFRFASESTDYSSGIFPPRPAIPPLLYMCSEWESLPDWQNTHDSYYVFDPGGVLVTITRVAGSSGRMFVDYTTKDGTAAAGIDYRPIAGRLVFDDFEMSKTLVIQITNTVRGGIPIGFSARDFYIVLTNVQSADLESPNVSPPRLDTPFAKATVRIQSLENPQSDPDQYPDPANPGSFPTHDVYNFVHKNFRVPRDITNYWTLVQVSVERTFKLTAPDQNDNGATINYRINGEVGADAPPQQVNNFFPLNPGSEYAIPEPSEACNWIYPWQDVTNWNNWDFQMTGNTPNADGTVTVPAIGFGLIQFLVRNDTLTKFNKDFNITIYRQNKNANQTIGEINECHVTILFDDKAPPAGSVDQLYNTDFGTQMKPPVSTSPPNQAHPGTDGTVWDLAVQPDDKAIIVGQFTTYNGTTRPCIARALPTGAVDLTFDPGSGANDGAITKLGMLPDGSGRIMIGGSFTHFNGSVRKFIARLLSNGQRDFTFNPLQDPNGTIWALAVQPNNQVIIAGDFTAIGTVPRAHIARLNPDGSLDTFFDPGLNPPNDTIWSVALQADGKVLIGGQFTALGGLNLGGFARLNSDGSSDTTFNNNLVPGVDGTVYTVVLQNGTDIVIGGEFQHVGIAQRTRIARLKTDATVDNTFNSGTGSDDTIYNIAAQPDGSMYVGGIFTSFNGTHRSGLTRLYPDGTVDTTFLDTAYNQFAGLHRRYFERQAWPGPGPDPNPDPRPFVYASQVLPDGNVVIGGGFKQVGGGQADASIRFDPDYPSYPVMDGNIWTEPKSRDGVRNRSNFARLIGGSTPGPGNIGLLYTNYFVNKSQLSYDVGLIRTNGTLGYSSANFAAQPGLAQSGVDYVYNSAAPIYLGSWWPSAAVTPYFPDTPRATTRAHSDGFAGTNELPVDVYGHYWFGYTPAKVTIPIKNSGVAGDINTTIQLANPSGADQFFLGGQNIPLGNALGVSAAPFTIVDDTQSPGTISFSSATYSVNEQGTNAVITIVRTNGSAGYPSVVFSTSDGTARAGSNYVSVLNKRVSFAPGITILTNIIVPIIDDGVSEPNGMTVNLRLSSVQGATLGRSAAVLNIIDNDYAPGYVTFSSAAYTTNESAGAVTLTVTRSGANRGTITVQCATTNVTAIDGVNYHALTNTLSWNDGDATPRYVTVPLIHDGLVGSNTTFRAFLFNPTVNTADSPGTILAASPTTASVTIVDDDYFGNLQFSSPSYLVNENGGYATLTVTRTGGTAQALSVNYATSDGSAVSHGTLPNFVATSGTLTFNPGEVSKSFTVPLLDDGVVDPLPQNFNFFVSLSGLTPPGASLGSPASAVVNIRDAQTFNQPSGSPDTSFVPNPGFDGNILGLSLQPNGQIIAVGSFTTVDNFPRRGVVRLNGDSSLDGTFQAGLAGAQGPVNCSLVQSDGRILIGGGFTNFNSTPVNLLARLRADGTLDSSFTLSAGGDNTIFALAETFLPDRRLLVGGSFINMNGATHPGLARLNNDGSLDATFDPNLNINGTVYAIAVYPTNTIQGGKILIGGSFSSVDGQSYHGLARLNSDGTLDVTFNPGGAGANDIVRAIAIQLDGRVVIGGAFTSFNSVSCGRIARLNVDGSVDGTFNAGQGADDSVAAIALQQDNRIVFVGQFTHANGVSRSRITRLMPDGTVDPSINFGLGADNFINALAIQPNDGMLVIGGGFTQFDGLPRPHLARLYGGSISGSGRFEFTSGNYNIDEDSTNAVITVRRRGGTSGNVSIGFATADNTAFAGVNYSNVTSTLYFPVGETVRALTIPVRQDFQITPDLVVNLALSNPLPPSSLGDQPVATLTILNDDCAVSFDAATYRVNEDVLNGLADFFAVRQGSFRRQATVDFMTTTNGTALAGFNYLPVTNTLVFQPGQSNALIRVPILPTLSVAEGDVTVTMQLTNADRTLLFAPNQAVLTIVDIDQSPGRFFFSQTNYVVGEADGFAYVTVVRTNGHTGVVNLNFNTIAGSATPGLKYGPTNFLMSFQDGETVKTTAIQIFNENQVEGTKTFFVAISGPGGAVTNILGPPVVPVSIIDDDIGVGFSSPIYISTETDPSVTLVVNRVGTNGTTSVSYATADATAVAATNYVPASGTLNFAPGETIKTFSVSLLHDPRVTGPLSFSVNLFGASAPAIIFTNNPATVTVNDADPGLAFTNANFYTIKSATNVLISVLRSNANTGIVAVNYSTVEGTALAGVDFIPTNGLLTFSNGIALQSFNVPIINNQEVAPDRTFYVNIFNPTAPGQILEPSTAAVTITNDLTGLTFSSPAYKVNENGVQALITVLRTGFTNNTVSVDYFTADGSGLAGINYSNVSGTLVFTNGETAHTFAVPIIDDSLVTGDKTVLLGLRNAVGHVVLVTPSASVLTMVETDGSLIVPAGTALIGESGPVNNSIDPGETVTNLFAFRNSAGTNTINLVATLLATNGISNPSGPQTYGVLGVHGPAVSRPFSFTANATNGQVIQATFKLTDGTAPTNYAVVAFVVGQSSVLFSNTTSIVINDNTNASPYPSTINVSSLPGLVTKAVVTLTNLNHDSPKDIDALLVSPAGQKSLILAKCGSDLSVSQVTLTFDDAAGASLPQFTTLASGTYRPTSFAVATPPFPPALTPPAPYANNLAAFNGFNPNGNWSLYVIDDLQFYSGIISNGWQLRLTTSAPILGNADLALAMAASPNPVIASSNLTYTLTLTNFGPSAAANVVVTDTLPSGAGYVSSSASPGTASTNASGQLIWNIAALTNGATASLTLVLRAPAAGFITNSASVTNSVADLNPDDDVASAVVLVTAPIADLAVGLAGTPNPVLSGNSLTYTITVTNLGPATATSVSVVDTLPPGVTFVSATPAGVAVNGSQVTFANLGDLGSGGQLSASIVVHPMVGGTLTNSVTTASGIPDPLKLNNSASIKTVVIPVVVSLTQAGANLVISWPADAVGYYLETSTGLQPPAVWTRVTTPQPVDVGGQQTVVLPIGSGTQFFRVHGQAQ